MSSICIIGGGASGMTAAITAKKYAPDRTVIILEKMKEPGRKLKATGNGRCNLSNAECDGYIKTLDFFGGIGVMTRTEESGRIYPYSEDAADVVDALRGQLKDMGIRTICHAEVTAAEKTADGFQVSWNGGRLLADRLLIASGGKAGPKFGSTGDGYRLARGLGHTVTRLAPALTAVETQENLRELSGVREKCAVRLLRQESVLCEERGEIQFTDYGVSGICVFNLSRFMELPEGSSRKDGFDGYEIRIDLLPEIQDAEALLAQRAGTGVPADRLLCSLVKQPLAREISARAGENLSELAHQLKEFTVHPADLRGWQYAQVTRGGVPYSEIHPETMESKICPGLFFAGEILDYDGPCGGYNLQHAWETGIKAGKGLAG